MVLCTVFGSVDVCIRLSEGHDYGTILFCGVCFAMFISLILFVFVVCLLLCISFSLLAAVYK